MSLFLAFLFWALPGAAGEVIARMMYTRLEYGNRNDLTWGEIVVYTILTALGPIGFFVAMIVFIIAALCKHGSKSVFEKPNNE